MPTTGSCLCGAIRYHLDDAPSLMGVCHCRNCQRQAGSAFSTLAGATAGSLHFDAGEPTCYEDRDTDSGNLVRRYFCGTCGSPIYSALDGQPDMVFLKAGTLDDTSTFKPQFHVWCDSKQNWVELDEGVPALPRQA